MISLGDKVVYRQHVCEVVAVRENYFEGKDYLELHALFENSLKLFVCIDDAKAPALRPVMEPEQMLSLIDSITAVQPIETVLAENESETPALHERHARELYEERLKTFAPEDLLVILKSAHARTENREQEGRSITATDKKYFEMAEGYLCDELAVSLGIPREEAPEFLANRIRQAQATASSN